MEVKQTHSFTFNLGKYKSELDSTLAHMQDEGFVKRLWNGDTTLWTGADENNWLGWLDITTKQLEQLPLFQSLANEVVRIGYTHVVLLGMGGSSLCAEVLKQTFGQIDGFPELLVLDSVVPAQVKAVQDRIDLKKTLCIVSSKSGSTTEPNVLCQYFYDQISRLTNTPGDQFIAITDPGSSLEKTAQQLSFSYIFPGVPSIGGRYSVLSHFGMIPAAIMGLDLKAILQSAQYLAKACAPNTTPSENPGLTLGTIIALLAKAGRDKLTFIASPRIASFGMWLEQLVAESTGKEGRGIVPIDGEEIGNPTVYGKDRLFVYLRLTDELAPDQDAMIAKLEQVGEPTVRITIDDCKEIGGEFFRWEFATAVAGSLIGINAFNQPNVQESKDNTKRFLKQYTESGHLPENILVYEEKNIQLFSDEPNKHELDKLCNSKSLSSFLKAHLSRIKPSDYFAITAYIEYDPDLREVLEQLRLHVRNHCKVATTFGYGPRFLHSTGQLHKGGPNSGVFLQITANDHADIPIPGEKYTFGTLKQAQSLGDFLALSSYKRRALRIHCCGDLSTALKHIVQAALAK